MDTYMDTYFLIGFPFNFLEFFFGNDIVAPKNWSGSVAGDGHDGEMVVAGEAQIVYGAVAQVVEGKVSQFCLLHSTAPLEFVIPCKIIDGLSIAQEYSVGVKSTGQIDEHFPHPRVNRYAALWTILGICARQPYEVPFKIDLIPGQLENFPLAHT